MPFTGQFSEMPVQQYANQYAGTNPLAGLGLDSAIVNAAAPGLYTPGSDPIAWFNNYQNMQMAADAFNSGGAPTLSNGMVRIPNYQDPGDAEGLGVMSLVGGGLFGAAGLAADAMTGAGASGFAGAEEFGPGGIYGGSQAGISTGFEGAEEFGPGGVNQAQGPIPNGSNVPSNFGNPEADNLVNQANFRDLSAPPLGTNLQNIFTKAFAPVNAGGSAFGNAFSIGKGAFDIGSGIYGLLQRKRLNDMAKMAFQAAQANDPGKAYDPVRALMADPSSVANLPGYQFGMDQGRLAIQRQGAASGSGGNEAIALARYTPEYAQNFYSQEIARRMALAQGSAGAGAQSLNAAGALTGASNQLTSSALGSIGYGAARLGGVDTGSYDQIIKALLARSFGGQ